MTKHRGKVLDVKINNRPYAHQHPQGLEGLGRREGLRIEFVPSQVHIDYAEMEKRVISQMADAMGFPSFQDWLRENPREQTAYRDVERLAQIARRMMAEMWISMGVEAMSTAFGPEIDEEGCGAVFAALMDREDCND